MAARARFKMGGLDITCVNDGEAAPPHRQAVVDVIVGDRQTTRVKAAHRLKDLAPRREKGPRHRRRLAGTPPAIQGAAFQCPFTHAFVARRSVAYPQHQAAVLQRAVRIEKTRAHRADSRPFEQIQQAAVPPLCQEFGVVIEEQQGPFRGSSPSKIVEARPIERFVDGESFKPSLMNPLGQEASRRRLDAAIVDDRDVNPLGSIGPGQKRGDAGPQHTCLVAGGNDHPNGCVGRLRPPRRGRRRGCLQPPRLRIAGLRQARSGRLGQPHYAGKKERQMGRLPVRHRSNQVGPRLAIRTPPYHRRQNRRRQKIDRRRCREEDRIVEHFPVVAGLHEVVMIGVDHIRIRALRRVGEPC